MRVRVPHRVFVCLGLVTAVTATCAVTPAGASAASAGTGAGCRTVHVGPVHSAAVAHSSYFQLRVAPGRAVRQAVIVANPQRHACKVTLLPAYGQTAINSGDTYPAATSGRRCVETSCWLSRLPTRVTVPARTRRTVPFVVSVPARTRPGQYLAGVVAQPAVRARAPRGRAGFGAAVIARVAIGVAVTVPGALRPHLTIPAVTLDTSGTRPLLRIVVRDPGNTWEHPAGGAVIRVGKAHRTFGVRSSTVLPRDSATLPLPVAGIPRGGWPTLVELWYDHHRKKAVWRGRLGYPTPPKASADSNAQRDLVVVGAGVPLWAKALIGGLGGSVLGLLLVAFWLYRRRRGDDGAPPQGPGMTAATPLAESPDAYADRSA
jgi:hypothetical protein